MALRRHLRQAEQHQRQCAPLPSSQHQPRCALLLSQDDSGRIVNSTSAGGEGAHAQPLASSMVSARSAVVFTLPSRSLFLLLRISLASMFTFATSLTAAQCRLTLPLESYHIAGILTME